jgi:hypothetical protein
MSTRLTQYYIRRAKSGKNHKFDKSLKKYESLTSTEKDLVFFPKLSNATTVEILKFKNL